MNMKCFDNIRQRKKQSSHEISSQYPFCKNRMRNTMRGDRFDALVLSWANLGKQAGWFRAFTLLESLQVVETPLLSIYLTKEQLPFRRSVVFDLFFSIKGTRQKFQFQTWKKGWFTSRTQTQTQGKNMCERLQRERRICACAQRKMSKTFLIFLHLRLCLRQMWTRNFFTQRKFLNSLE